MRILNVFRCGQSTLETETDHQQGINSKQLHLFWLALGGVDTNTKVVGKTEERPLHLSKDCRQ